MGNLNLIHEFQSLEELKIEMDNDLKYVTGLPSRFPIRFIFLNSYDELKNFMDLMNPNTDKIELSKLLKSDDEWFTHDEIIKEIENIRKNTVVLPISEFIRFSNDNDFTIFIKRLSEIEKNTRIYIPLVGLWERFEELFWKNYYRKEEWGPVWRLKTVPKQVKAYQIKFGFDEKEMAANDFKIVSNSKEWFNLWKKDNVKKVISLAKYLSNLNSIPDRTFIQEVIETPKEYLSKICEIDFNIKYEATEQDYWSRLISYISNKNNKNISLKSIVEDEFNINNANKLKFEEYLLYYLNKDNKGYKQWLIKNLFLNQDKFKNSYLNHCFNKTNNLDINNLAESIFLEIFSFEYDEKYIEDRREMLKLFDINFSIFENQFMKKIETIDSKNQLSYLTDTTLFEKEKIFEIIQEVGVDKSISKLRNIYPDLYNYLDWSLINDNFCPEWINSYFKEYTKSKVLNSKSNELDNLLIEHNQPDKFYDWYYLVPNIQKQINDNNHNVWIDGLGAEWLPLMISYLRKYCDDSKKITASINSVYIPSATKFNKIKCDEKIAEVDKYIHDNHYNYPKSLIDEIELIKIIAKKISKLDFKKVNVFSDHGFSFLCTKHFREHKKKKYDFKESEHEGRYLSIENDGFDDCEDYIITELESSDYSGKYIVALNHTSLYNMPSHEVHGGATPEEVLVPYITIENNDSEQIYELISSVSEINISNTQELSINIKPSPTNMPIASCEAKSLNVSKQDKNNYIISLSPDLSTGKHEIAIIIDDYKEELEIDIKKGGMEEEEYDFGW